MIALSRTQDKSDIIAQAPDLPALSQTTGNGAGSDFAFAVYTQLAQIQRDVGALTIAQIKLDAHVKDSEVRMTDRLRESELRLTELSRESEKRLTERVEKFDGRVEKIEKNALDRVKTTEDKVSSLKDFVHQLFWTGAGVVAVLSVILGWKPILAWVSTYSV
jgi:hypothetical protein